MPKSSTMSFISIFLTLALGGLIYFVVSSDMFNWFHTITDHKMKTLLGLLCASSYYFGIIVFMGIQKINANLKLSSKH